MEKGRKSAKRSYDAREQGEKRRPLFRKRGGRSRLGKEKGRTLELQKEKDLLYGTR